MKHCSTFGSLHAIEHERQQLKADRFRGDPRMKTGDDADADKPLSSIVDSWMATNRCP
jgi:hypothetical protein